MIMAVLLFCYYCLSQVHFAVFLGEPKIRICYFFSDFSIPTNIYNTSKVLMHWSDK